MNAILPPGTSPLLISKKGEDEQPVQKTIAPVPSSVISKRSADLRNMWRGRALWKSVQGDGGGERRGPFAVAEQEKEHTPVQY